MVMSESTRSVDVLYGLNELGVRLSCDDFGTGYSSLAHLRRLPIGEIKIDKSFIARMTVDESDRAIARSVLASAATSAWSPWPRASSPARAGTC